MAQTRSIGRDIDIEKEAKSLSQNGVVVIENYYSEEKCDKIYREAMDIINRIDYDESEIGEAVGDSGKKFSKNDMNIAIRGGRDKGMFDIRDIDNAVSELKEFKQDELIRDIIGKVSSTKPGTSSTNLYYKESNTSTRGAHHDTFNNKFKSFIYLTDVDSVAHGPFSYVEGSHNPSFTVQMATRLINKIKGRPGTDSVFYDEESARRITGGKGTLIISNQTGVHFGEPQKEGYERMLVTNHHTI